MPRAASCALTVLGLVLGGCTGRIEDPVASDPRNPNGKPPIDPHMMMPPPPPPTCEGTLTLAVPLRRMNDLQYRETINVLFNGLVAPSVSFPSTTPGLGYSTFAEANVVSDLGAEQLLEAAEDVAEGVVVNLPALLPCSTGAADEPCARSFIDTYASRAFRRPLLDPERDLLLGLFRETRADTPFAESIGVVVSALLEMPQFLYFVEENQKLDGYETATRLSYLLWNGPPDDALLAAADAGDLADRTGIEREARRMMNDPRASKMIARFFHEWIDLGDLAGDMKDPSMFPEWSPQLEASLEEEVERFVAHVIADEGATIDALLTSNKTYVNRPLASLYGLDPSLSSGPTNWVLVTLDPSQRSGLLTKAALLAAKAHASTTAPVFRGKFVRTQLLCDEIPAPPPDAMAMAPEYPPNATQREKSDILVATQPCGGCHGLMNPIGLGFEHYDAIGRWRDNDTNGAPVDVSGEILNGTPSAFDGAVDLSQKLASSDEARDCMVRHVFRYGVGIKESTADACTIQRLDTELAAKNYSLTELIVSIAASDAFVNRGAP